MVGTFVVGRSFRSRSGIGPSSVARRLAMTSAALLLSAVVLTACGGSDDSGAVDATPDPTTSPSVEETIAEDAIEDASDGTDESLPEDGGSASPSTASPAVGTASFHAVTSQGYEFDAMLTWYAVRDVTSEAELAGSCGWDLGTPFAGGNDTFRAALVTVESADRSPAGFEMEFPFDIRFANPEDPHGLQIACPGGEAPSLVQVLPGEPTAFDLLWASLATPNRPTGFDYPLWDSAEIAIPGVACEDVKTTGTVTAGEGCAFTALTEQSATFAL